MPRRSQPDARSPVPYRILAAAARHPEHRITRPDDIKPPTYRSALQALRRRGLITDSSVESGSGRRAAGPILSPAGHGFHHPLAQIQPVGSAHASLLFPSDQSSQPHNLA